MTTRRTSTQLATIAIAIAALLSTAVAASACPAPGEAPAKARGCCIKRAMPACGCCTTPKPPAPEAPATTARGDHLVPTTPDAPASSCECRASEPASRTDRQAPPTVRTLDARSVAPAAEPAAPSSTALLGSRPVPDPNPRPIFLRTSHLLF